MITVRFCEAHDPISTLVRMASYGHKYTHVEFVLSDGSYVGAHARDGVAKYPRSRRRRTTTMTRCLYFRATPEQEQKLLKFLYAQVGRPYDFKAVAAIAASFFFGERNWRCDQAWFCSELVTAALEHAGIIAGIDDVARITPRDCWIYLNTQKDVIRGEETEYR